MTDHKHAREAFGSPVAVSSAGSDGSNATLPRSDHVHAHEAAHINHDTTWAAKGDLIVATANDAASVLTVGSDTQILTADSAQTTGTKWAAPAAPASGSITLAMMANITPPKIIGRGTASAGVPEALVPTNIHLGNATVGVAAPDGVRVYGDLGWSFDPVHQSAGLTLAAATVYLAKIPLAGSGTTVVSITNVWAYLGTKATSTLTHAFAGVVGSNGTLIGMSVDNASGGANWSSTGSNAFKTMALSGGPFNYTPTGLNDFVYACLYIGTTAGTAPIFRATAAFSAADFINHALSAATSRAATQAVADTATPFASLTLSSNTATAQLLSMGIS